MSVSSAKLKVFKYGFVLTQIQSIVDVSALRDNTRGKRVLKGLGERTNVEIRVGKKIVDNMIIVKRKFGINGIKKRMRGY
jgi:hypothetical protein